MMTERPKIAYIMKYVVLVLIIAFVVILMLNMSGSSRAFEDVAQDVESALNTEELTRQEDSQFKRNFGLNAADYSGVMYYSSSASMSADEVLLICVRSDGQVQDVTAAIEERIASRKNDFEGYAPEEAKLLDDAVQSVRGRYIFYAVSADAQQYLEAFGNSL